MDSKELKDKTMNLISSVYDAAEKLTLDHMDDTEHQGFGVMCDKISKDLTASLPLVKEVARAFIVGRGDIEIVKGPHGGMRWKKIAEEVKPEPVKELIPVKEVQDAIKEIKIEDKQDSPPPEKDAYLEGIMAKVGVEEEKKEASNDLVEAIKTLVVEAPVEIKEEVKQEEKVEAPKDPNALPTWAVADVDPMSARISGSNKVWK